MALMISFIKTTMYDSIATNAKQSEKNSGISQNSIFIGLNIKELLVMNTHTHTCSICLHEMYSQIQIFHAQYANRLDFYNVKCAVDAADRILDCKQGYLQYLIFFTIPLFSATKRLSLGSKHKSHGRCKPQLSM